MDQINLLDNMKKFKIKKQQDKIKEKIQDIK